MKDPKRTLFVLFFLALTLNFLLRFPWYPHEQGWDSFYIHGKSASIVRHSSINYIYSLYSYLGMYPFSYASAIPTTLAATSIVSGLEMEFTILLFTMSLGLFSFLSLFIAAREVVENTLMSFLAALSFSVSPAALDMSTWQISTRGPFMVLFPIFLFFLIRSYRCHQLYVGKKRRRAAKIKYYTLTILSFLILVATHHLYFYTIPIIISYFVLVISKKTMFTLVKNHRIRYGTAERLSHYHSLIILVLLIVLLLIPATPIFEEQANEALPRELQDKSKIEWFKDPIISNARYFGMTGLFAVFGIFSMLKLKRKTFGQMVIMAALCGIAPFFFIVTYTIWFTVVIGSIFVGWGIMRTAQIFEGKKKRLAFLVVTFLVSLPVTAIFQVYRPGYFSDQDEFNDRWMSDRDYDLTIYMVYSTEGNIVTDDSVMGGRITTVGGIHDADEDPTEDEIREDLIKNTWTDPDFWSTGPYDFKDERAEAIEHKITNLEKYHVTDEYAWKTVDLYSITYVVINTEQFYSNLEEEPIFYEKLGEARYCQYANEKGSVWYVGIPE